MIWRILLMNHLTPLSTSLKTHIDDITSSVLQNDVKLVRAKLCPLTFLLHVFSFFLKVTPYTNLSSVMSLLVLLIMPSAFLNLTSLLILFVLTAMRAKKLLSSFFGIVLDGIIYDSNTPFYLGSFNFLVPSGQTVTYIVVGLNKHIIMVLIFYMDLIFHTT